MELEVLEGDVAGVMSHQSLQKRKAMLFGCG